MPCPRLSRTRLLALACGRPWEIGKSGTKSGKDGTFSDTYLLRLVWFFGSQFFVFSEKGELPACCPHLPASVADKRLTVGLSPLDATLTKIRGVGTGGCPQPSNLQACQPFFQIARAAIGNTCPFPGLAASSLRRSRVVIYVYPSLR